MAARVIGQPFEFTYADSLDEYVANGLEDSSGNFFLVGAKGKNAYPTLLHHNYSGLIIKMSATGDTLKTKIIPPYNNRLQLDAIIEINDSILAVIGSARTVTTNELQLYYAKIDKNLNILDEKFYGSPIINEYYFLTARKSFSNEIITIGNTSDTINFDRQIVVYKLSLDGDSLNSYYFGNPAPGFSDNGTDILEFPDTSGYLVCSNMVGLGQVIHKLDFSGNVDTSVVLDTSFDAMHAEFVSANNFIVFNSGYDPYPETDLKVAKFDLTFNKLNTISFGKTDTIDSGWVQSIGVHDSNNIYLGAVSNWQYTPYPNPQEKNFFCVAKINSSMQISWIKYYSKNNDYLNLFKVIATKDGGVLILGTRYNSLLNGPYESDIYILKLDSLGNFVTGINDPPIGGLQVHDVIVYPNPAQDVIKIQSSLQFYAAEFVLYDATGRKALEKKINKNASISVSHLPRGLYFYRVKDKEGGTVGGKIILQ